MTVFTFSDTRSARSSTRNDYSPGLNEASASRLHGHVAIHALAMFFHILRAYYEPLSIEASGGHLAFGRAKLRYTPHPYSRYPSSGRLRSPV